MKRGGISLIIIGLHVIIFTIALWIPVTANTVRQESAPQPTAVAEAPVAISIRQQVPLTITIQNRAVPSGTLASGTLASGNASTMTDFLMETIAVTLDLQLDLTVTDTLTVTVPSTVTLTFADQQTTTMLVSVTVGLSPTASVAITRLPAPVAITTTDGVSLTAETLLTPTLGLTTTGLTTTVPPQVLNPTVVSTVAITTNLRSGPNTTFDLQTIIGPGTEILVVAQNADGTWYLLNNGLWLAAFLVDTAPVNLPIATEDLVTTLRERNPITPTLPIINRPAITLTAGVTATGEITATAPVTAETTTGETEAPASSGPILIATPVPGGAATGNTAPVDAGGADETSATGTPESTAVDNAATVEPPSATVDANLRDGPGTTFNLIGGTITGQALNIVGRNEDGGWFLLDNGGWVAAFLIANAPDLATVPLASIATGADLAANAAITATTTATATLTITPTVPATPTFGVQENLYVIRVDGITDRYNFALAQVNQLIATAQADATILENQEWIIQMTTMITLLRSAGDELASLTPPVLFTDAHAQLLQAATDYSTAADLLAAGIDQGQVATFTSATDQINAGGQALATAQNAIEILTP